MFHKIHRFPKLSIVEISQFLEMDLSIYKAIVLSRINDKRDNFDFKIVNFPFLDGDVSSSLSYGV